MILNLKTEDKNEASDEECDFLTKSVDKIVWEKTILTNELV